MDTIYGDAREINGAAGVGIATANDFIEGGEGRDTINGDTRILTVTVGVAHGGRGSDIVNGEGSVYGTFLSGNNTVYGGAGRDTLDGNAGTNTAVDGGAVGATAGGGQAQQVAPVWSAVRVHGGEPALARLVARNAAEYERWTARDLRAALRACGVTVRKSDGAMVIRADDVADALTRRDREHGREAPGSQGVFPDPSRNSLA